MRDPVIKIYSIAVIIVVAAMIVTSVVRAQVPIPTDSSKKTVVMTRLSDTEYIDLNAIEYIRFSRTVDLSTYGGGTGVVIAASVLLNDGYEITLTDEAETTLHNLTVNNK